MLLQVYWGDFWVLVWQRTPQRAASRRETKVCLCSREKERTGTIMSNQIVTVKGAALQETSDCSELWSANVMNHKSPLKWEQTYKFFLFQYVQIPKQFWVVNLRSLRTICSSLLYSTSLFRNSQYMVLMFHCSVTCVWKDARYQTTPRSSEKRGLFFLL